MSGILVRKRSEQLAIEQPSSGEIRDVPNLFNQIVIVLPTTRRYRPQSQMLRVVLQMSESRWKIQRGGVYLSGSSTLP